MIIFPVISLSCSREESWLLYGMSFSFCVVENFVPLYYFFACGIIFIYYFCYFISYFYLYLCTVVSSFYAVVLPITLYYVVLYGIVLSIVVICI